MRLESSSPASITATTSRPGAYSSTRSYADTTFASGWKTRCSYPTDEWHAIMPNSSRPPRKGRGPSIGWPRRRPRKDQLLDDDAAGLWLRGLFLHLLDSLVQERPYGQQHL